MFHIGVSGGSPLDSIIDWAVASFFQWSVELHSILGMLWQFIGYNECTLRLYITATDTNAVQSHLFDVGGHTNFVGNTGPYQSWSRDHEPSDRQEANQIRFESIFLRVVLLWL